MNNNKQDVHSPSVREIILRSSSGKNNSKEFCTLPGKEQHPNKETRRYYSDVSNSNVGRSKSFRT